LIPAGRNATILRVNAMRINAKMTPTRLQPLAAHKKRK
jgi:hypothetical protein